MTLLLNVTKVKGPASRGYLYIQGGQGGMYKIDTSYGSNDQRRTLYCSKNDKLRFMFCSKEDREEPVHILAENTHYFNMLSERLDKQGEKQAQTEYTVELFNEEHQKVGFVELDIMYVRGLDFQGLVPISFFRKNALLSFFFGKCPTKNLFNFLDDGMKDYKMNWIQNVYRDF